MSWNIGFSRNLVLKLQNKLGLFRIVLQEKTQKFSLTVLESQNLPKLQDLDTESQISQFEWTLHNGRRKVFLSYRSDIKKVDIIEYRRKGNTWKNNQNFQLEKKEYDNMVDFIPSVLSYVETFKKTCIIIDECTVENERSEIESSSQKF